MDIYKDIANRTGGDIYIGVVGPVRTGKSTFIKRFMDLCVLPFMEDGHLKERTIDELPQSSQGKTIMTTEPKFIPQNAVNIQIDDNTEVKVRLVDCVGFVVEGANGHLEGEHQRMVRTPWFEEEIPFEDAAKIGTLKVIQEHATIGIVVTTDGSFSEIERRNYIDAEERTITEMEQTGKPYVILLNSERPYSTETEALRKELETKYLRPVIAVNCKQLQKSDIVKLLESVLLEFPISTVEFYIPKWTEMLSPENSVKKELIAYAVKWMGKITKMRDLYTTDEERSRKSIDFGKIYDGNSDDIYENYGISNNMPSINATESVCTPYIRKIHSSNGTVELRLDVDDKYYYAFLSEIADMPISSEYQLIDMIRSLSQKKQAYEKVEDAIKSVEARGYGVVTPTLSDITMEEPALITHAGRYGVKIRANSPSIHMIRANIETEIAPIVGNKEQAENLISYIKDGEYSADGVWSTNIFGKTLGEMMEDGIRDKIGKMDDECQTQLQNTMQKIVNDNNGGLVCIII